MLSELINTVLSSASGVTSLVGTRIRPANLAQDDSLPAIVYECPEDQVDTLLNGTATLTKQGRVTIVCQSLNRKGAETLANAVRDSLNGYHTNGTVTVSGHLVRGIFHDSSADDDIPPLPGQEKPRYEMIREFEVLYI